MKVPGLSALDEIVSEAIKNVYKGINEGTERFRHSFDLFGRFRKKHTERISKSLSTVQILGMSGPQRLTDLYVPSRLSPRIARNVYISDEKVSDVASLRAAAEKIEANIFDVLQDKKYIVILGGAGSGKTTFTSAVTLGHLNECEYISNGLRERFFPISFTLRELGAPTKQIVAIIQEYLNSMEEQETWPFLEKIMQKGKFLIVLDGLDEIPIEEQENWRLAMENFEREYPRARIIVTCRSGSLEVDFKNFAHFEVLPFSFSEIQTFIESWFITNPDRGRQLKVSLKYAPRVSSLTSTPLLLSLLCNLFNNDLEISNNRTELYSRCIEVMLTRWDTSRGFRRKSAFQSLSITRRKRIFEEIAHHFSESLVGVMKHDRLVSHVADYIQRFDLEKVDAVKVLNELETHHGILIRMSANYWSFSHISFQEYFCAEYIKDKKSEENYLRASWTSPRRAETLIFIGTLLEDATDYISLLIELTRLSGITTYPALSRRLRGIALLTRLLAQGVTLSKAMRKTAILHVIDSVVYVVEQLAATGINLYMRLVNDEPRLGYTYYKRRSTAEEVHAALNRCVYELSHCNHTPFFNQMKEVVVKSEKTSIKLAISACFYYRDVAFMKGVFGSIDSDTDTKVYLGNIAKTLEVLDGGLK